ncbi:MAG: glycoside hydrolase family 13 protein [Actinomycetes bacterium]
MPGDTPWWHRAAIYQIYPRSFRDLDGDGTGDLRGVISELAYVASLGVDAVWLSPFYPSPQRDSGYDVADPRDVDPMYGTLDDARELIEQAHARGLRVIIDVVPNHSSSDRAWFQQALAAAPGSGERARYHFVDGRGPGGALPPNNWTSWFGGGAWSRVIEADGRPGQWYLHTFDSTQPDLNWSNADVRADGLETLRFWMDLGADGFRVDVALGLMKDLTYPDLEDPEGLTLAMRMDLDDGSENAMARRRKVANSPVLDRDEVQDVYREWRALMDTYDGDKMAVAEAWVPPERAARYVAPDTLHQIFNFDFMAAPWDIARVRTVVENTMQGLAIVGAPPTWALSNHDTPRVVTRLGGGPLGVRRARAMALLAHCLPGAVYVYQGEELGLADAPLADADRQDPVFFRTNGVQLGRDGARVPMPWSGDRPPYGFSDLPSTTWLPQPDDWAEVTVQSEESDPASALHQYATMLRLRHAHPGLIDQSTCSLAESSEDVLVLRRGAGLCCVINFSTDPVESPIAGRLLVASDAGVRADGTRVMLPASTGAWLQT